MARQDTTYLEVVRPISGADKFLDQARTLGSLIFASDEASGILTVSDKEITGETGPLHVGTTAQLYKVFDTDGLRLPLLERVTIPSTHKENAFNSAAKVLRYGKEVPKKLQRNDTKIYEIEPIKSILNRIQTEAGYPNPDELRLRVSRIGYKILEEIGNGNIELTLVPDLDEVTNNVLIAQSKECAAVMKEISKGIAYPTHSRTLGIPFASVSDRTDPEQTGRFIDNLSELLPIYVRAREPRITNQVSS